MTTEQLTEALNKIESKITEVMDNMKPGERVPGYIKEAQIAWIDVAIAIEKVADILDIDDIFTC
jgi:hypothetical protein